MPAGKAPTERTLAAFLALFLFAVAAHAEPDGLGAFIVEIKNVVYEVVMLLYCIVS